MCGGGLVVEIEAACACLCMVVVVAAVAVWVFVCVCVGGGSFGKPQRVVRSRQFSSLISRPPILV